MTFFSGQLFSDTLSVKMSQLKAEKKRCDRLLYQMLPVEVARQLRQNRQVNDAEMVPIVSVMISLTGCLLVLFVL